MMGVETGTSVATLNTKEQTPNKPGRVNTCQASKTLRLGKGLITLQGQDVRSRNLSGVMGQEKKRIQP